MMFGSMSFRETRSGVVFGEHEDVEDGGTERTSHPEGIFRKINPSENVYSFMMFTLPLEEARGAGLCSWKSLLACAVVASTLIVKSVLLWAIFQAVVLDNVQWQQSIFDTTPRGPANLPDTGQKCSIDESLCHFSNGTYSCAPPSVQLTGRWDELDINGDGVWTREEAVSAKSRIECKYGVDPVEVHRIFIKAVLEFRDKIWMHPDVASGRAIHKAYFTYAAGQLIMCGYRNSDMCANLLQRGAFDAPLKYGTAPRVGRTIDSALDYCHKMLDKGGFCERHLPSAYAVWKKTSERQCWGPRYEKFVYAHPTDGETKSMLILDYKARKAYSRASESPLFLVFRTIIVMLFLLALFGDFKDISVTASWVINFPSACDHQGAQVVKQEIPGGGTETLIQGISKRHRIIMGVIVMLRVCMLFLLTCVGVTFLLQEISYKELLLNGVALVFVIEIANLLFSQVLDPHLQEQFSGTAPMYVRMWGFDYLNRRPALRDVLGFLTLCLVVLVLAHVHWIHVANPLSQALECACLSSGPHCREAVAFDKGFWDKYWAQDVPGIYQTVAKLKDVEEHSRRPAEIKSTTENPIGSPANISKIADKLAEKAKKATDKAKKVIKPSRSTETAKPGSTETAKTGGVHLQIAGAWGHRERRSRHGQSNTLSQAKLTSGAANS